MENNDHLQWNQLSKLSNMQKIKALTKKKEDSLNKIRWGHITFVKK